MVREFRYLGREIYVNPKWQRARVGQAACRLGSLLAVRDSSRHAQLKTELSMGPCSVQFQLSMPLAQLSRQMHLLS